MQDVSIAELDRRQVLHSWSVNENFQGVEVARAEGSYFWDTSGKRWFDLSAQLPYLSLGFDQLALRSDPLR